jgi:benzoate membrane transport protein
LRFFRDLSLPAFTAGFVAVLVGFTSSVAIVFQAATALGATPEQISSWMWALGLGMGLCSALPSLVLRKPVMVAWSTPGAAVLATAAAAGGFTLAQATGAFIVCALLMTAAGATGWFERVMDRIPMPIASALLAGVLARFGLDAFLAARTALPLVLLMLGAYLVGRRLWPRYAVPGVLAAGTAFAAANGQLHLAGVAFTLTTPVAVVPEFTLAAMVSLALPLFVVTMASQNLPGVAAITAAICMGPEAHEDPDKRYTAAVSCGAIYVVIGLFGAAVTGVLTAFPRELVVAVAGLALLSSIAGGLAVAVKDETHREAALITFLVTLSGLTLAGIGSAFWGVVAGALALAVQRWRL